MLYYNLLFVISIVALVVCYYSRKNRVQYYESADAWYSLLIFLASFTVFVEFYHRANFVVERLSKVVNVPVRFIPVDPDYNKVTISYNFDGKIIENQIELSHLLRGTCLATRDLIIPYSSTLREISIFGTRAVTHNNFIDFVKYYCKHQFNFSSKGVVL